MVAKLIRLRRGNYALAEESTLVEASAGGGAEAQSAAPVRPPYQARHAKAVDPEPPSPPFLPVRSAERRRWSAELVGPGVAGIVVHGVGGIGKSVLAAQILDRVSQLEPRCVITVLSGEVTAGAFLAGVAAALRRQPEAVTHGGAKAVAAADRADLPWAQRLALLREHVLDRVPLLLVLDNFDENLSLEAGTCTVRDPSLIGLLASWADPPHRGRLLITCRHRFAVPHVAAPRLRFRHLGPLSRTGASELVMSLPALGLLGESDLDRSWRLLAGHPRAMEYLDALLAGGARFTAVADRLAAALGDAAGHAAPRPRPAAPTELPLPRAEATALKAAGVLLGELLGRLSVAAQGLLIRASVYRSPIGHDVLLRPVGQYRPAEFVALVHECRAVGLLAAHPAGDSPSLFVHRWTALELHRLLTEQQRGGEITDAHRRAAEYWRWRITTCPGDHRAQSEAGYHLLQVSELSREIPPEGRYRAKNRLRPRLRPLVRAGAGLAVTALLVGAASVVRVTSSGPESPESLSPTAEGPPAARESGPAAMARGRAAARIASQVGGDVIVACDPAMCSPLLAHRVLAGNRRMLRSTAADPLVYVRRADGSLATFRVTAIHMYPQDRFPAATVRGRAPGRELRLITRGAPSASRATSTSATLWSTPSASADQRSAGANIRAFPGAVQVLPGVARVLPGAIRVFPRRANSGKTGGSRAD